MHESLSTMMAGRVFSISTNVNFTSKMTEIIYLLFLRSLCSYTNNICCKYRKWKIHIHSKSPLKIPIYRIFPLHLIYCLQPPQMVELPDWLSTLSVFQKSAQNPWHLIHCLKSRHLIRGYNLTHILPWICFHIRKPSFFRSLASDPNLRKRPGNTPLSGTYLSFLDIKTTVSTCDKGSIAYRLTKVICPKISNTH